MPAGLLTTMTSPILVERLREAMASAAGVAATGAGSSTVMTSPSRTAVLALTLLTRGSVTCPSSIRRWICERE